MSTPQQPPVTAILEALKATKDEVAATKDEITALRRYGRRNRSFVIVDVVLTVLLAAVGLVSAHAASQSSAAQATATQNRTAQIVTCQASNQARAQNEQLWTYTLTLFKPKPGQTPQQQERAAVALAALHAKVEQTFAPRDCTALARGEKP